MMTIPITSDHIALLAIASGIFSAFSNSAIENLLNKFVDKSQEVEIKSTLLQGLVSGIVIGPLLGVIFYAFALYGSPIRDLTPVELIAIFTIYFGLINPLLGIVLKLIYSKLRTIY